MAHPSANKMFCSPGIFRLILFLVGLCFVVYTMRQQLFRHNSGDASVGSSCPVCHCDCSAETTLPLPLGESKCGCFMNDMFLLVNEMSVCFRDRCFLFK